MGSISFVDLGKLQLYIGMVVMTALFLSLWVLPKLVSCLTSLSFKEVWREFKLVCFLPFATAIPTLALPYINHSMRRLAERKNLEMGAFRNTAQTIVPIGFGFAQIGNFIPLLFIFFLSFFYRHPFTDSQSFSLPFLMTLLSIGTPQFTFVALPYLLKQLALPHEGFSLYAEISAITLNFQVLLSTASMLTFMYVVTLRYYGLLEVHWRKLVLHVLSTSSLLLAFSIGAKNFIHTSDNYHNLYYSLSMSESIPHPPEVEIFTKRVPPPPTNMKRALPRILERRTLRVGYDIRNIPFCYLNEHRQVVGYDMAYAYQLAKDLDVKLQLIPFDYETLVSDINTGFYDIAMSAIIMDEERILDLQFTNSYIEQPNVLVVPVNRINHFTDLNQVQQNKALRIGAIGEYASVVRNHFPQAILASSEWVEELQKNKVDCVLWSELPAYIWCLAHPGFTTVSFGHSLGKKYFAYPCDAQTDQFIHFLNDWINLKQEQGFELKQREYWFLGKIEVPQEKRWSIIRNVLHWVE
jgi:ABC-type amino acid transport substrate-binding protein